MYTVRATALCCCLSVLAGCATTTPQATNSSALSAGSVKERVDASMLDAARDAEKRGDYPSAQAYYRSAYDRDQKNIEAILGLSRMLRALSRPREAVTIAERGLLAHERQPQIMAELGKGELAANDTLKAIESLSRAGVLLPDDWEIQSALGVGYDRLSMYDQAAHRYEKALAMHSGNAVVLNNYALSLAQAGKLEEAVAMLEKAVSAPERTTQMRQNLALLYAMTGRIKDAERLVHEDLPPEMAAENIKYYRRIARNTNRAGTSLSLPPGTATPQLAPAPGPRSEAAPPAATSPVPASPVAAAGPAPPPTPPPAPVRIAAAQAPGDGTAPTMQHVARPIVVSGAPPRTAAPVPERIEVPPAPEAGAAPATAHVARPIVVSGAPPRTAAPVPERIEVPPASEAGAAPATAQVARPTIVVTGARQVRADDTAPAPPMPAGTPAPAAATPEPPQDLPGQTADQGAGSAPTVEKSPSENRIADASTAASQPMLAASAQGTTAVLPKRTAAPLSPSTAMAIPGGTAAAALSASGKPERRAESEDYGAVPPAPASPPAKATEENAERKVASVSSMAGAAAGAAKPAPEPPTSGSRPYRVQIGSYRNEADAKAGIARLLAGHEELVGGLGLGVVPATIDGDDYYRVLTAPMASKGDAAQLCERLQSREVACFVRREP
jgi:Flp pilus assembly protein TadD